MSSLRRIPTRSSRGRVPVHREDAYRFQSAKLLQEALVLLKVHNAVQFHIIHLATDDTVSADELLRTDTVVYAPQVDIAIK